MTACLSAAHTAQYVCVHMQIRIVFTYVCVYVSVSVYRCVCVCVCVCILTCNIMYAYYTRAHTHTSCIIITHTETDRQTHTQTERHTAPFERLPTRVCHHRYPHRAIQRPYKACHRAAPRTPHYRHCCLPKPPTRPPPSSLFSLSFTLLLSLPLSLRAGAHNPSCSAVGGIHCDSPVKEFHLV